MKRAAIYSRFSTDLQNEKSIDDQEALAKLFAERQGFVVVKCYSDAALSGGSMIGRVGLLTMLDDAKNGLFEVIIVEELDRLSRDMEDLAGIHKRLTFQGIDIVTVHEGVASTLTVGLRGMVGQLFREDNARKVRRGLAGKVNSGRSAGGLAYGYRPNPLDKGKHLIDPDEAKVILRIYHLYLEGESPKAIAKLLNEEGVPGYRGGKWQASSIYGWAARGNGILRNQMYAGMLVWNRLRMIKDPDTGKRISRRNDPKEWMIQHVEEFRIVPQDLFDAIQKKSKGLSLDDGALFFTRKRPARLLSGLIRCGACGGGMAAAGKDRSGKTRLKCSTHTNGGQCPNPRTYYLERIESAVVDMLTKALDNRELMDAYVHAYNEERKTLMRETLSRKSDLESKVNKMDKELDRLMRLLIDGSGSQERLDRDIKALEVEYKAAKVLLDAEPKTPDVVLLHPTAITRYKQQLERLREELTNDVLKNSKEIGMLMRELIDTITLNWTDKGVSLHLKGSLLHLLSEDPLSGVQMVARDRYGLNPRPNFALNQYI